MYQSPSIAWQPVEKPPRRTSSASAGSRVTTSVASELPIESSASPGLETPAPMAVARWSWPATTTGIPAVKPSRVGRGRCEMPDRLAERQHRRHLVGVEAGEREKLAVPGPCS